MDFSILFGFLIGVVLALPPGPVGVTAIEIGLSQDKKSGFQLALGNAIMDFIYFLSALFATSAIRSTFTSLSHKFPAVYIIFQVGVIVALLVIGYINFKTKPKLLSHDEEVTTGFTEKLAKKGPIFLGIAIALANLANPTFLPSIAALTIWVQEAGLTSDTVISHFLFALGFGLGNLFWVNFLASMTNKYKDKFSPIIITRIKQSAGIIFMGFGAFLLYRLITSA